MARGTVINGKRYSYAELQKTVMGFGQSAMPRLKEAMRFAQDLRRAVARTRKSAEAYRHADGDDKARKLWDSVAELETKLLEAANQESQAMAAWRAQCAADRAAAGFPPVK